MHCISLDGLGLCAAAPICLVVIAVEVDSLWEVCGIKISHVSEPERQHILDPFDIRKPDRRHTLNFRTPSP
mgnify:CR=1 FL=1